MCPSSETENCTGSFSSIYGPTCAYSLTPGNSLGLCALTGSLTLNTAVIIGEEGECCPVCNI
jgi:hypothetical protein